MDQRQIRHGIQIHPSLFDFIENEVLPGLPINGEHFWLGLTEIFNDLTPKNKQLLAKRETLQQQIDQWHLAGNDANDSRCYLQFLTDIGYLLPEPDDFAITTANVDPEVASIAGPQLVVPLMNARYALNAANARWGSLYDALYGTDAIDQSNEAKITAQYNPERGRQVIEYGRNLLDSALPLNDASHRDVTAYKVENQTLCAYLGEDEVATLVNQQQFIGYRGSAKKPQAVICCNNGLHIEIVIDSKDVIGKQDLAGVKDITLESAVSTIQDCEDSIAAVDGADKTAVYRNWLGLMKGDLSETLVKSGKSMVRTLKGDKEYTNVAGEHVTLPGRSLQFIRNVGHLMTTDAVLDADGNELPEGILDALITSLIGVYDVKSLGKYQNSRTGSIYIVKPKMHGPEEVAFTNELFGRVEQLLELPQNTIKMGIMDEERRTSANLKTCIYAARARVAFINTGFLDRTGDEIHTSMHAGAMVAKDSMKNQAWIAAYESRNVAIGLQTGLKGKAQIGKGMWAVPDHMGQMMLDKIGHPLSGASCAWVPSPTAATLHAMHYHQVNVGQVQQNMLAELLITPLVDLLHIPLLNDKTSLSTAEIQAELDNNIQGLLGYVVRWVDQGIGCSKVPDIDNIGRMEDRATLRISSQHICNWWHHGLLSEAQIVESLQRMAAVVDEQNSDDPQYHNMADNFAQSIAFKAASDLIFKGKEQPSGYTEPLLHQSRMAVKAL